MPAVEMLSTAEIAGPLADHVLQTWWQLTVSPAWYALCLRSMVRLALRDGLPELANFYLRQAERAEAALTPEEKDAVTRMAAANQI